MEGKKKCLKTLIKFFKKGWYAVMLEMAAIKNTNKYLQIFVKN